MGSPVAHVAAPQVVCWEPAVEVEVEVEVAESGSVLLLSSLSLLANGGSLLAVYVVVRVPA